MYIKAIGLVKCCIQPGYEAQWLLKLNSVSVVVTMKIEKSDDGPVYQIVTSESATDCKSLHLSSVVKDVFRKLNYISSKNWSDFQFFGLNRSRVVNTFCLILKFNIPCFDMNKDKQSKNSVIVELMNMRKRGSGKSSSLLNQKAIKS